MDYSELSTEALELEVVRLSEEILNLQFMLANFEDENGYESYESLQGQITGCEQLIDEIKQELERRK